MSDTIDDYRALKAYQQAQRRKWLDENLQKLAAAGIAYRTSNAGVHCQVDIANHVYDIWPSTEKWRRRDWAHTRFGIGKFIGYYREQQRLQDEAYVRAMERAYPHLKGETT